MIMVKFPFGRLIEQFGWTVLKSAFGPLFLSSGRSWVRLRIVKNAFHKKLRFSENHIEVGWGPVQRWENAVKHFIGESHLCSGLRPGAFFPAQPTTEASGSKRFFTGSH
jgi:hypothetical protein